jgi:hypothetical protein
MNEAWSVEVVGQGRQAAELYLLNDDVKVACPTDVRLLKKHVETESNHLLAGCD